VAVAPAVDAVVDVVGPGGVEVVTGVPAPTGDFDSGLVSGALLSDILAAC